MADEAELAFVATMRDEASRTAKEVRRNVESTTGQTKPIETPVRVKDEATRTLDGIRSKLKSTSTEMQTTGRSLTRGLTLPIVGFGVAAGAASIDFSRSMGDVASLLPGNVKRVEELRDAVKEVAEESGSGLTQVSRGLYQTLSAFGDTADTAAILANNAKAARAGAAEVSDAIALTSAVTKSYGDTSAKAVAKASDLALLTVRMGQTTFPELASSIGLVTPLTKNLNASQEELFATMATFTGVTGGASEVSTQLRGALQALMAPTADAAKALKGAGYESGAALVEQKGLAGAITFLTDEAKRSGKPLQSYIGSIEGQTIALGLAGAQGKTYAKNLKAMSDAQGTTQEAFDASTTGVGKNAFKWDQAKVKANELAAQLGDDLAPALYDALEAAEPVLDVVKGLADQFSSADPETRKMIVGLVALAAAGGPVLWTLGSIGRGVSGLIGGVQMMSTTLGTGTTRVKQFAAELSYAETRGAALGRVARTAAGPAGIGALALGATTSNDALSSLANVGGGALLGFSAGGPIGAAIGGTVAGLYELNRLGNGTTAVAQEVRQSWNGVKETLDAVTGATTAATRAFVYDKLQKEGTLDLLKQYGLANRTVVDAVLGEKSAREQVGRAVQSEAALRRAALTEAATLQTEYNSVVGSGTAEESRRQAIAKLITAWQEEAAQHGQVISDIRGGIGAIQAETAAQKRRGDAVNDYDELLARVKSRGKIVTYLETSGVPRSAKAVAKMQAQLNLTPKRVTTVLEALGVEVNRKRVRQLVADLESANKTKGDLGSYRKGVESSVGAAAGAAQKGGKRVREGLENPVKNTRPNLSTYTGGIRSGTSTAAGVGRAGGGQVGSGIRGGTMSALSGFASELSASLANAVGAAIAAAKARAKVHSPSRETMWIGQMMGRGLTLGLEMERKGSTAAARKTIANVLGVMAADLVGGEEQVGNALERVQNRIEAVFNAAAGTQIKAAKNESRAADQRAKATEKRAKKAAAAARAHPKDEGLKRRAQNAAKVAKKAEREATRADRNASKVERQAQAVAARGIKGTTKAIAGQVAALQANAKEYDRVSGEIEAAKQKGLDFAASIKGYADVSQVNPPNEAPVTAGFILQDLQTKLAEITAFRANLAKLRGRLNDDMIDQLEAGGVAAGGAAAAALVGATQEQLNAINQTQGKVAAQANAAGTESVAGLVKGLTAELGTVKAAGALIAAGLAKGIASDMAGAVDAGTALGKAIKRAIRRELKIKSPSRVTTGYGGMVSQGLANGILDEAHKAETAAADLARRVSSAATPSVPQIAAMATRAAVVSSVAVQSTNVVTIRHEVVSPDGTVSTMTAAQVADLIARDPRSASVLEGALRGPRRRSVANTITASDS